MPTYEDRVPTTPSQLVCSPLLRQNLQAILSEKPTFSLASTLVFDEISFRENFAKLATKRFSCFSKTSEEFCEFRSILVKVPAKVVFGNSKPVL
jgi:hypothetical protein